MRWRRVEGPLRLEDILFQAGRSGRIAPLQVVRPDRVVGPVHLEAAARLADRARREGRSHAQRPEVEFLRYLAGERQIRRAVEKMGVADGAPEGLVVGLGPGADDALDHFVDALGLRRSTRPLVADETSLRAFGVTQEALEATTPDRRLDLVLEAVASVDLS